MPQGRSRFWGRAPGGRCLLSFITALALCSAAAAPTPIRFNRQIRPILADHCYLCHGPDKGTRKAGLRLDDSASALQGVKGRPAIVPGNSAASELIQRVLSSEPQTRMPQGEAAKPLTPAQLALLQQWVDEGAQYEPHWAYVAPGKPTPPATKDTAWPRNPVDAFLLADLEKQGLHPSPEADRRTLLRRLSFDLTGLPPTPEDVAAFTADTSPQAYEHLVDKLLASPHYGERLALYWLDLVRFADTCGYHGDQNIDVWPYRDYVIGAFNGNLSFAQFTREQLAGDLLPNATLQQKVASAYNRLNMVTREGGAQPQEYLAKYAADRVRTTSSTWLASTIGCAECHDHKFDPFTMKDFYSLEAFFADVNEPGVYESSGFYDPFPPTLRVASGTNEQQLNALTARVTAAATAAAQLRQLSTNLHSGALAAAPDPGAALKQAAAQLQVTPEVLTAALSNWVSQAQERLRSNREAGKDPAQWSAQDRTRLLAGYLDEGPLQAAETRHAAAQKEREEFEKSLPQCVVTEAVPPRPIRLLPRGNWMDNSGPLVDPAVPHFLSQPRLDAPRRLTRLDLANWLVSRENPLTARVFVNRLWKLYFGTGLSKGLDDLGTRGEWPPQPELLDWLAVEFMDSHWDVKHMVRLLVTSSAYRQSSKPSEQLKELDPYNRLYARQSRWRLEAEFVRDNALAISGLLSDKLGGPSANPYQPADYYKELNFPKRTYTPDRGEEQYRRGLYTHWQRTFLHPSLSAFDAPTREECTAERNISNTPLQALTLLNDPTYVESARVFAQHILEQGGASFEQRLRWAYQRALNRDPAAPEAAAMKALFERELACFKAEPAAAKQLAQVGYAPAPAQFEPSELSAWTTVGRTLLNLHESIVRY